MPLTADFARTYRDGIELDFLVKTNSQIYAGALVMLDTNGLLIPGADTANCKFAGVALRNVLGDGVKTCRVRVEGVFEVASSGLTQAAVGALAYLTDDTTAALYAGTTNHICCGRITKFISATKIQVKINSAAQV